MNANKTENKWDNRELGALWTKVSKDKYMTGHINSSLEGKIDIVIFSNKEKKSDKSPDFRIYASDRTEKQKELAGKAAPAQKQNAQASSEDDDGVL